MKEIAQRIWEEPAVAIGGVVTLALAALAIIGDEPWNASTIAGIAAPLLTALGIRTQVTPTTKVDEALETKIPARPLP